MHPCITTLHFSLLLHTSGVTMITLLKLLPVNIFLECSCSVIQTYSCEKLYYSILLKTLTCQTEKTESLAN